MDPVWWQFIRSIGYNFNIDSCGWWCLFIGPETLNLKIEMQKSGRMPY
jgi:hypothetical protein